MDDEDVARRATNTWERRSAYQAGARLTCLLKNYEQCHGIRDPDRDTISPRPLLFISGDQAHSREFSEDAYRLAAEPKELYWVTGAGHVDLYDRVELIPFAKLTQFFQENLSNMG